MAEKLHLIRASRGGSNVGRAGLRLPDKAWTETIWIREKLPPVGFRGFPHYRLQIFQIIDSRAVRCWTRTCGVKFGKCQGGWTHSETLKVMLHLETACDSGMAWLRRETTSREEALLATRSVFDAAWLRE